MTDETFPARFKFALQTAGLTPGQLDRGFGWRHGESAEISAGRRNLSVGIVHEIAEALGCSFQWLQTGKPRPAMKAALAEAVPIWEFRKLPRADIEQLIRLFESL